MSCHIMMSSSFLEYDQPIAVSKSEISPLVLYGDRKDDVFDAQSEEEEFKDLSDRFEQMQASESSELTSSYQPDIVGAYKGARSIQTTTVLSNSSAQLPIKTVPKLPQQCTVYTCQAASSTVIEGIQTSVKHILGKSMPVPKIVIESVPYSEAVKDEECCCKRAELHPRKILERHRSKDYYRPYCMLSRRRHVTTQPITIRRRRFGVSQRGSGEPCVNELAYLLETLSTDETASKERNRPKPYSSPLKYYMIRYKPSASLANIKEKSRSLSDLSIQPNKKVSSKQSAGCSFESSPAFHPPNEEEAESFIS